MIAGRAGTREGLRKAWLHLMEPLMQVHVTTPEGPHSLLQAQLVPFHLAGLVADVRAAVGLHHCP